MSAITVPSGIDDATTRALAEVIDERFGAIPVEKALVWHLRSQGVDSLRMAGEFFGLSGPEFGGATPTAEVIQRGVALRRTRGTSGAQLDVLGRLGFVNASIDEDAFRVADGSSFADGEWRAGGDRNEAFYQSYVDGQGELELADGSLHADGSALAGFSGDGEWFDFADGTAAADGSIRAGADTYLKVWDVVSRWSRPGTEFAVGVRIAGAATTMMRERP